MHFCHVTTFYPPHSFGGDAIGLQRLCHALARRGHRNTVICDLDAYFALHQGAEPAPSPEPMGVDVVRLRSRIGSLSCLLTQQLGTPVVHRAEIRTRLEDPSVDVINYHNVSLVGGPGALELGTAPKLYMAHEHWLVCPSHVLWRHDREPCDERQCLRCVLSYRRPPQLWRSLGTLRRVADRIDAFIAMSEFSRSKHAEFGFASPMSVMPYFIPDEDIARREAHSGAATLRPQERPYFLFVGRLERIKGLNTVIPAFERYAAADLLIAGDGNERPALERLAAGNPRVKFLGRVSQADLARYYEHAISLIVPSIGFETFGIILIESFLQGTPVIARRMGPFPEIVEKADGGELFGDDEELVGAMTRMQQDPARRQRMGTSARQSVRRFWSESAVMPQYLALVELARERHRRRAAGRNDIARSIDA